jgi:hypothetical protein
MLLSSHEAFHDLQDPLLSYYCTVANSTLPNCISITSHQGIALQLVSFALYFNLPRMRESFDTDRTHVATQANSSEHLDTLTEKKTNMTKPVDSPELEQRFHSRQQYNDSFDGNDVVEDGSLDEIDVEKGDESSDNERAEQLKRKESKQKDPNLIEWDGPSDPENPQNWPSSKVITSVNDRS